MKTYYTEYSYLGTWLLVGALAVQDSVLLDDLPNVLHLDMARFFGWASLKQSGIVLSSKEYLAWIEKVVYSGRGLDYAVNWGKKTPEKLGALMAERERKEE